MRIYFLILSFLISTAAVAQTPNYLYGRDVVITTRDTSSAELTIKNSTRNVPGYFKNIGGGKGRYTLIPQIDITGLPDSLLARYTKTQSDARYKPIGYFPSWAEITGIPANFTTTYALSNDVRDSIQARVNTYSPQIIEALKTFNIGLRLGNQLFGDSSINLGQVMAVNDYWHIYGADSTSDYGEMVFKVGDNGAPYRLGGQRFRFTYDGTGMIAEPSKDVLIIDYDTTKLNTNLIVSNSLGVGGLINRGVSLGVSKNITDSISSQGFFSNGVIQSDVTNQVSYFRTAASTRAASFTLADLNHYRANQFSIGAGSSITNQTAFLADATLTGAANNFGFRGLIPAGIGRWNIYVDGTANNFLAGSLGIGSVSLTGVNFRVSKTITGAASSSGVLVDGVVQSDANSQVSYFRSGAGTQATAFTLNELNHFRANQITIGAGSSVTNQNAFLVDASLTGAINNYAFRSQLASGTGRWGAFFDGTANNYFNGRTLFGTTIDNGSTRVQVAGDQSISGSLMLGSTSINSKLNILAVNDFSNIYLSRSEAANTTQRVGISSRSFNGTDAFALIGGFDSGTEALVRIGFTGSIGNNAIAFSTAPTYAAGAVERARFNARGAFLLGTSTDNGQDIFQAVGSGNFTSGLTAQRGRFTSLVLNKDSVPITNTNIIALFQDSTTGRINRQYVSGSYTPTITAVTNVAASTANVCFWSRDGNMITVTGYLEVDPTTGGAATEFRLSLPIATSWVAGNSGRAAGVMSGLDGAASGSILADIATNTASFRYTASAGGANMGLSFTFTYLIQ